MTMQLIGSFLLWCIAFNYGVLILWFAAFTRMHGWMYSLHSRWFRLSPEQFDTIHYQGMAGYKLAILFFNVVPYCALRLATHAG
ncbi:MAG: hypothetical protein JO142_14155 [Burkholderiales bacterium]|nr:hypothetical protein [Burkholderiales bacterium]